VGGGVELPQTLARYATGLTYSCGLRSFSLTLVFLRRPHVGVASVMSVSTGHHTQCDTLYIVVTTQNITDDVSINSQAQDNCTSSQYILTSVHRLFINI